MSAGTPWPSPPVCRADPKRQHDVDTQHLSLCQLWGPGPRPQRPVPGGAMLPLTPARQPPLRPSRGRCSRAGMQSAWTQPLSARARQQLVRTQGWWPSPAARSRGSALKSKGDPERSCQSLPHPTYVPCPVSDSGGVMHKCHPQAVPQKADPGTGCPHPLQSPALHGAGEGGASLKGGPLRARPASPPPVPLCN